MSQLTSSASLRPATAEDEAFLLHLFGLSRPEFGLLPMAEIQIEALIAMQFQAQRQQYAGSHPQADSCIIMVDGQSAGRMLVDRSGDEIVLIDIALVPEHQGAGIGTSLIQSLLDEAAEVRKPVRLHVLKSNPALRLYERLGFSRVADQSMYFEMISRPAD